MSALPSSGGSYLFLSFTPATLPRKTLLVVPLLTFFGGLESSIVIGQFFRCPLFRHERLIVTKKVIHLGHRLPPRVSLSYCCWVRFSTTDPGLCDWSARATEWWSSCGA